MQKRFSLDPLSGTWKGFCLGMLLLPVLILNAAPTKLFETSGDEDLWEGQFGANLSTEIKSADSGPDGKICTSFRIRFKDPSMRNSGGRWFNITKAVTPEESWKNADGVGFELAADAADGWYVSWCLVEEDGTKFAPKMTPFHSLPTNFVKYKYRFRDLFCKTDPERRIRPEKIIAFSFGGGSRPGVIYFRNFELLEREQPKTPPFALVRVTGTGHPDHTLEAGQEANLRILLKRVPGFVGSLKLHVQDYRGKTVYEGTLPQDRRIQQIKLGKLPTGYYEVRISAVGKDGIENKDGVIITSGTQVPGVYTFAVSAETAEAVKGDIVKRGCGGFFGIQNIRDQFGAVLSTGAPWKIEMPRWSWDEPVRPVLSANGLSPRAEKQLAAEKQHDYIFGICSFTHHAADVPKWARTERTQTNKFGVKDKNDFKRYVGGVAKVNAHRYSHMERRPYELTWEPNLSGPHYSKQPPYWTVQDTVDFYRDYAPVIRANDPKALILGPKPTFDPGYIEKALQLGLGKYIDAISIHMYGTQVPEEGELPAKIARLRELGRKYMGREIDLYNTEAGYHSKINGVHDLRGQARKLIRYTLIMQGEGVKAFLMFYLFDHSLGDYGSWGLYFNPQKEANFGPRELMPKPIVPAYSVLTSLLRGARPVMHLRWMDTDLWGYVFERDGVPVLALWDPYRARTIRFPAGNVGEITAVDIMGKRTSVKVEKGIVSLEISPDVIYLTGVDPAVWMCKGLLSARPGSETVIEELSQGEVKTIAMPVPFQKARVRSFGDLDVSAADGKLRCSVPGNAASGVLPVILEENGESTVLFIRINRPVVLKETTVLAEEGVMVLQAKLRSSSTRETETELHLTTEYGTVKRSVKIPPGQEIAVRLPIAEITKSFDPLQPLRGTIQGKSGAEYFKRSLNFTFLAASGNGRALSNAPYTDHVRIKGTGASGKEDGASVKLSWDRKGLRLQIECRDDVFHQTLADSGIWRGDSLQIAFDTDPDNMFEYDELTRRLSKKVTSLGFALSPKGPYAYRYRTFSESILKTGNVTEDLPFTAVRKDGVTRYDITVPWHQIGMKETEAVPGKKIGFSLLVNDHDGAGTNRRTIALFGGIYDNSGWRNYGVLNLK